MAPLFSKVDLNKLWHDVQNEETLICAKFGKDLFNISKVIGRKKVFFDSQCITCNYPGGPYVVAATWPCSFLAGCWWNCYRRGIDTCLILTMRACCVLCLACSTRCLFDACVCLPRGGQPRCTI